MMTTMPRGPKPQRIDLTDNQRRILEQITRRAHSPQAQAMRARIVLVAAQGKRNQHIADGMGISVLTVRRWRNRWSESSERLRVLECEERELSRAIGGVVSDAPRPGTPATFTPEQICQIIALACEVPDESDRPVTHWTPTELADEAIRRGIVEWISPRSVGRFLKRGRS